MVSFGFHGFFLQLQITHSSSLLFIFPLAFPGMRDFHLLLGRRAVERMMS